MPPSTPPCDGDKPTHLILITCSSSCHWHSCLDHEADILQAQHGWRDKQWDSFISPPPPPFLWCLDRTSTNGMSSEHFDPNSQPLDISNTVTFCPSDKGTESGRIWRPPQKQTFRPKTWPNVFYLPISHFVKFCPCVTFCYCEKSCSQVCVSETILHLGQDSSFDLRQKNVYRLSWDLNRIFLSKF